jgi:hypothetical protein
MISRCLSCLLIAYVHHCQRVAPTSQGVMVSRKHQEMWQEVQNLQPRKPMTRLVADELEKAHLSEFQELSKCYAGGHTDGEAALAPMKFS